jgi:hypothetical protein
MSSPEPPRDNIDESIRRLQTQAASRPGRAAESPRSVRLQWFVLLTLAFVVIAGGVIAFWPSAAEGVVQEVRQAGASLGSMIELRGEPARADASTATGESGAAARVVRLRPRRSAPAAASAPAVLGNRAEGPRRLAILAGGRLTAVNEAAALEDSPPAIEPPAVGSDAASDLAVYSSMDVDVAPPSMRSPESPAQVLRELPQGADVARASPRLELLINAQGEVEQARLHTDRPHMLDAIVLSRAKTWQFEPARRAGTAVPYLLRLEWESSPQ